MPPTRGHDLKPDIVWLLRLLCLDAPHTGARLETLKTAIMKLKDMMPPTRGHDLKLSLR